jgi:hypothetical protein
MTQYIRDKNNPWPGWNQDLPWQRMAWAGASPLSADRTQQMRIWTSRWKSRDFYLDDWHNIFPEYSPWLAWYAPFKKSDLTMEDFGWPRTVSSETFTKAAKYSNSHIAG